MDSGACVYVYIEKKEDFEMFHNESIFFLHAKNGERFVQKM